MKSFHSACIWIFFLAANGAISILSSSPVFLFPEAEWHGVYATILLCTPPSEPGLKRLDLIPHSMPFGQFAQAHGKETNLRFWGSTMHTMEYFPPLAAGGSWLHLLKEAPGPKQAWKCLSQHRDVQWGNHTGRFRPSVVKQTQPNNEMGSAGLAAPPVWQAFVCHCLACTSPTNGFRY